MPETLKEIDERIAKANQERKLSQLELVKTLATQLLDLQPDSEEFSDKAFELREAIEDCD